MRCLLVRALSLAAVLLSPLLVHASPVIIELDLTGGALSNVNGALVSNDTYDEDGFRLQLDRATDHMDDNVFDSDLYFHNGPTNFDNIHWTLSFGGGVFDLLSVDISAILESAASLILTGSNSHVLELGSLGLHTLSGFNNVSWVRFDIAPDGGTQGIGLDGLEVGVGNGSAPEPRPMFLMGLALVGLVVAQRRSRKSR